MPAFPLLHATRAHAWAHWAIDALRPHKTQICVPRQTASRLSSRQYYARRRQRGTLVEVWAPGQPVRQEAVEAACTLRTRTLAYGTMAGKAHAGLKRTRSGTSRP